jgi:NitT/TauT family transport system permease protein
LFTRFFIPYARVGGRSLLAIALLELAVLVVLWTVMPLQLVPTPLQILQRLGDQLAERGLLFELAVSLKLNFEALVISSLVSLGLAYSFVLPVMRPVADGIAKLRFSGSIGWSFILFLLIPDGHWVKVMVIVFGMTPYLTTTLVSQMEELDDEALQHARTLRLGHLGTTWQVVIRGRLDQTIEAIRQNAAIGWMMVATAESLIRTEGGVGVRLAELSRYMSKLPDLFAVIFLILLVGALQDALIRWIKVILCPYASLERGI